MKRWIIACALLAVFQLGLTFWTNWGHENSGGQAGKGPLLALQTPAVNGLVLEDNEGRKLQLNKPGERWVLPDSSHFPADSIRVQGLVDKLVHLQRGWPEAATSEAAIRFKVAPENFAHRLTLLDNGKPLQVVYFGTSPGLRKLYLRVDKDPEIHSLAIAAQDLETRPDAWIDTTALQLKADQLARVHLPGLELEQGTDGLQPVGLQAGEELVKERRDSLVSRLTGLSITALLGTEVKPEYGLDHPALEYRVELRDGSTISYLFGQPPKPLESKVPQAAPETEASMVLKVSNQEQLVRVDGRQVDELKRASRAQLVQTKAVHPAPPVAESGPSAGSAPAISAPPPQPSETPSPPAAGQ